MRCAPEITERRKELTLEVLSQVAPCDFGTLLAALRDRQDWPQAEWAYARNEPYDTGTRQHLYALLRKGRVQQWKPRGWADIWAPAGWELRPKAANLLDLMNKNKSADFIASQLGLNFGAQANLLTRPFRVPRRRKRLCRGCGEHMESGEWTQRDGWCESCAEARYQRLLPEEEWGRACIEEAAAGGLEVVFGVTPDCKRVIRVNTGRGVLERVLGAREKWECAAAELLAG